MTAENVLPPSHGDAGRLDEAGVESANPAPARPRRCTLSQIESALDAVVTMAANHPQSTCTEQAKFLEGMVEVIIDGLWAAHHYRTRGHYEVKDEPDYLHVGSWVRKEFVNAADQVVRWIDL